MWKVILLVLGISAVPVEAPINLKVKIAGFDGEVGNVVLALYRSIDEFPSNDSPFRYGTKKVSSLEDGIFTFYNLPKDNYAVAVYHDVNKNGKLDKNLVGMPTERYGFSNNARGVFSSPSFDEAKFSVDETTSISILIY